ncbi:P-loop containing nucleoside triphosphate hydrolase protein [Flammula alnicola]|nr:P-loop containing nucleoside triphosphate hydrolase protein [Flammula alnicola]
MSGCTNITATNATLSQNNPEPFAFPTDISSLITLLLSFSALGNWLKLVVLGSVLETCRRLGLHFYYKIYSSFFITARFDEDDSSYDWMMVWLSSQPSWKQARDVQISTRTFGLNSSAVMIEGEEENSSSFVNNNRQLAYIPSVASVHSFWYKRHWVRVSRSTREGYYGRREDILEICILSRDHLILNDLLIQAKKTYQQAQEHMISVYVSDISNNWRHIASRPKRPLTSIVLDPGIKDLLIDDARDFLESKSWYSARGIPFRRGYLLYGAPGSGKTSIIHSLAGELGLDVYVISLSRMGLDDTSLGELISELPEKCIALMEDIDAAFSQTLNREPDNEEEEKPGKPKKEGRSNQPPAPSTSRITLSGLLNALDGVGAQEGRILFATTNKYSSLDPALCRPGRMDIHIEFKLASKYQAQELYRCFYLPDSELDAADKDTEKKVDDSGYSSTDEKEEVSSSASDVGSITAVSEPVNFNGSSHRARAPKLSRHKVASLAAQFSAAIPEREFSMAALQGYLMAYKVRPYDAVKEAPAWVEKERAEITKKSKAIAAAPKAEDPKDPEVAKEAEVSKEPEVVKEEVHPITT